MAKVFFPAFHWGMSKINLQVKKISDLAFLMILFLNTIAVLLFFHSINADVREFKKKIDAKDFCVQ